MGWNGQTELLGRGGFVAAGHPYVVALIAPHGIIMKLAPVTYVWGISEHVSSDRHGTQRRPIRGILR
jgi:hypothetical protein